VNQQINVLTFVERTDVTAIQELGVIINERHIKTEVVKIKAVPLFAKQSRGDLMSAEAFCMLLITANLLQPTSTQRGKYVGHFKSSAHCTFYL
jgi:predicted transcriptional regulator of viral defense system